MKILEIACGFSYSNIYKNLFDKLHEKKVDIEVYVPQHNDSSIYNINKEDFNYSIHSNKVINKWDKYIYFTKIYRMRKDIENNFEVKNIKLIHAHSLFSDGGVAYELNKKYGIKYIVAVRDTDVNQYFKKAKHLKPYALKILRNASAVIFLSKTYKENVLKSFIPKRLIDEITKKSLIIPNGISKYWLDNIFTNKPGFDFKKTEIRLIFVGKIIRRKNIESIIKASIELSRKINKKISLVIVGEKKDEEYYKYLTNLGEFEYEEYCLKERLIEHYRSADIFVMPSYTETFGLVYAEAMSQGLPVIYSSDQGFDGQFEEGLVGYKVNPSNVEDIANKIHKVIDKYNFMSKNCVVNSKRFDWDKIAQKYNSLYINI